MVEISKFVGTKPTDIGRTWKDLPVKNLCGAMSRFVNFDHL